MAQMNGASGNTRRLKVWRSEVAHIHRCHGQPRVRRPGQAPVGYGTVGAALTRRMPTFTAPGIRASWQRPGCVLSDARRPPANNDNITLAQRKFTKISRNQA